MGATRDVKMELALKLRGHIRESIDSPFANYVVQKIIEVLPALKAQFVLDELAGSTMMIAQHRFGVRILCRLLEHCPQTMIWEMVSEVTENAAFLGRHKFGTYVVHHVIEYGTSEQRRLVMAVLAKEGLGFAENRHGSKLLQHALLYPEEVEDAGLLAALLEDKPEVSQVATKCYVPVLKALEICQEGVSRSRCTGC